MNQRKPISTGWMIFWLIFFFPVGVYYLVRQLLTQNEVAQKEAIYMGTEQKVLKSTRNIQISGWILVVIGIFKLIGFVGYHDFSFGSVVLTIAFIVSGITLIRNAKKSRVETERYKNYYDLIMRQQITNLDELATTLGLTFADAVKDIETLIDKKYLQDVYIDRKARRIVIDKLVTSVQHVSPTVQVMNSHTNLIEEPTSKTIQCPGCGATNVVTTGTTTACEYCAIPLAISS